MSFNAKRLGIALIFGFLSGVLCYLGGIYLVGVDNNPIHFFWIVLNRTLIGFVIGLSNLDLNWALHGALIGATIGLLFPFYIFICGGAFPLILIAYFLSILFGIFIEFFTSIVFKAKVK
ncbi:MAG: hypothetical protein JSW33_04595 [bacterium]|nr:MAG: hypothetical protein JSW33_04595 [bacterium]